MHVAVSVSQVIYQSSLQFLDSISIGGLSTFHLPSLQCGSVLLCFLGIALIGLDSVKAAKRTHLVGHWVPAVVGR